MDGGASSPGGKQVWFSLRCTGITGTAEPLVHAALGCTAARPRAEALPRPPATAHLQVRTCNCGLDRETPGTRAPGTGPGPAPCPGSEGLTLRSHQIPPNRRRSPVGPLRGPAPRENRPLPALSARHPAEGWGAPVGRPAQASSSGNHVLAEPKGQGSSASEFSQTPPSPSPLPEGEAAACQGVGPAGSHRPAQGPGAGRLPA